MKKILTSKKGQGLVEVIIAMTILIITTTAAMVVVISSKNLLYMSEGQTKATALAQEGIEIVRNNRNAGCAFNDLTTDTVGALSTSCHVIWSDMVGPSDANNTSSTIKPVSFFSPLDCTSANQIDKFDGFTRTIYLYDLADASFATWATGFGGSSAIFDERDKYYVVKVKVAWKDKTGDRNTEISTIMLKRWKD